MGIVAWHRCKASRYYTSQRRKRKNVAKHQPVGKWNLAEKHASGLTILGKVGKLDIMGCEKDECRLSEQATAPKSVSGDQGTVVNHGLKDQIELDRYLASKCATKSKRRLFNSLMGGRYLPPSARGS